MQNMSSVQPELTSMRYLRVCRGTSTFQNSRDVPVKAAQIPVSLHVVPTQILGYARLHHSCLYKVPQGQISLNNQFILFGALKNPVSFWMEEGTMELGERREFR